VLGEAGVGKSVFANALFNRSSKYKNPDQSCFEGGTALDGGKTKVACVQSGLFLNNTKYGQV